MGIVMHDDDDTYGAEFGIATLQGGNALHEDACDFADLIDTHLRPRDMLFGNVHVGEA